MTADDIRTVNSMMQTVTRLCDSFADFRATTAATIVPRTELDARLARETAAREAADQRLHDRLSAINQRMTRLVISTGILLGVLQFVTVAGVMTLLKMVAAP